MLLSLFDGGKSCNTATLPLELINIASINNNAVIVNDAKMGNVLSSGGNQPGPNRWAWAFAVPATTNYTHIHSRTCKFPFNTAWTYRDGSQLMRIYCNSSGQFTNIGGSYGTTGTPWISPPLPFDPSQSWHRYEFEILWANSATGFVKIYVDGQLFFQILNVVTAGFSVPISPIIQVTTEQEIGLFPGNIQETDIVFMDASGTSMNGPIGWAKVDAFFPSGDGATLQWTPTGGGTHFNQVNSQSPQSVTYVQTNGINNIDEYNVNAPPANVSAILAVAPKLCLVKTDATFHTVAPYYFQGGGNFVGNSAGVGTTLQEYQPDMLVQNPISASGWVPADISTMQFGVKLTA